MEPKERERRGSRERSMEQDGRCRTLRVERRGTVGRDMRRRIEVENVRIRNKNFRIVA